MAHAQTEQAPTFKRDPSWPKPLPNNWGDPRAPQYRVDPEQFKSYPDYRLKGGSPWTPGWTPPPVPSDGKFPVKVIFRAPGTYV